jgi:hypothetical protein
MVSNEFNIFGAAPDKGTQNGPVWGEYGGIEGYMRSLQTNFSRVIFDNGNFSVEDADYAEEKRTLKRQGNGEFWLTTLGPLGKVG